MSRKAIILWIVAVSIFIGLFVSADILFVGTPAHPMTTEQMQALLRREVPMGASVNQVNAWLDAHNLEHFTEGHMAYATLRDTSRGFLIVGFINVKFSFDKNNRLVNDSVDEDAYGL